MTGENIIFCDCKIDEILSFRDGVERTSLFQWSIENKIANEKRTGKLSEMKRYFKYFNYAMHIFFNRKKYLRIIGWQQFYALIYCFYCSLFRVKKTNVVVALNFTYKEKKGVVGLVYRTFMKMCVNPKYLDYLHIPSYGAAKEINQFFDFPIERIIVAPFGVNDFFGEYLSCKYPQKVKFKEYVLAIGRSNRDYKFLLDAWEKMDFPLVIISDKFDLACANPNVQILRDVSSADQYPYIWHSKAVVLPLLDGNIASGDTVLLTSMSFKKKVVVTQPSTLVEMYVKNFENGFAVEKDIKQFNVLMSDILFTSKYDSLDENARKSYLENFSRCALGKNTGRFLKV